MTKDEAMKLALEALEELTTSLRTMDDIERGERAITALREALAKQPAQQEPVGDITCWTVKGNLKNTDFDYYGNLPDGTHLLYTTPPAQRTWVGLTDDELLEVAEIDGADEWFWKVCKAVEAKLKELNT